MPGTWKAARRVALSGTSLLTVMLFASGPSWAQTSAAPAEAAAATSGGELEEIIVTGSRIRGVPPVGSNLISVSNDDIKTIGATTTADLLATVPQLNSFNTAPRASSAGFGTFAPGLRGLPSSATLTLMNGHRLASAAANDTGPDYPNIPSLALERVEVVPDGASSVYGSDAIAGVVNFITRQRFSGAEADVRYGMSDGYHSVSASGVIGRTWATGSFLAAYEFMRNTNITGGERDYRVQDFRPSGGVDTRSYNCPSANVVIPQTGALTYAAPNFAPGTINYCDNNATVDLLPRSRLHSGFLSGRQELGERVTVWADLLYSDRKDIIQAAPPVETLTITRANPYFVAPPGSGATSETVLFRADNLFGSDHLDNTDNTRVGNSSVGVDVQLPADLNLSVYGTFDWSTNDAYIPGVNPVALAVAAAGTTTATALDPFGQRTAPGVAAAITTYPTAVTVTQHTNLGALKLDGPLFDLPGGPLKFAAGAEFRNETFTQRGFVGTAPVPEDLDRDIYSAFGEVFAPIVGAGNEAPLLHRLSLSVSGRYDHYSDFGSTSNPKVGINWDPVEDLTIRGSYGKSFRAPGMRQVGATVGAYYLDAASAAVLARDPSRGAAQVNTVYLLGGNRDLQPETARTYSVGIDWQPHFLPDFRASATFYDIKFDGAIGTPPSSLVFTDPTFTSVVYRNPTPAQLAKLLGVATPVNLPNPPPPIGNLLDERLGNFGIRATNGLDFDFGYHRDVGFGTVFAGLAGNYILKFDTQLSPTAPVSDSLRLGLPQWTFRASLGATVGALSVVTFVNYQDGVTNSFATPTGTGVYSADPYTTVDLRVTWTLPDSGMTSKTELALQINDLLDKRPPYFPATDGIGSNYNPIGRFVALNIRKGF
ncbi:iron complex outermembrane receptor protein [Nitrospirillum amazonense]|uniref:Iron complex outermembrane receptor protein n=1 Tax=Nitrospirillum amazonense TaxID=28077 RepID=A0A560FS82_9PROT|nr:TonB-dependent receptor [Nitrospirillum amazonense]TWB24380.1 iron complex outermembrane receptor protein [Nitrospirillum amazonense]